ncbi:hypothetical protein DLAC_10427 [Tieghemostelium lacteum]|uniref:Thioredoxin domain-containing protein n=1 Tax=Tieghemostelium lacteum TaxID=361077 RepID=A0A151Z5D3_TIELA|nr:hypothetical protein DLAC_10427 [Tieghemostelium lacteum]|eukprot:KYQ89183.1 hypothetical protein DLAC_10427 [Tieghemostelium lacteum]
MKYLIFVVTLLLLGTSLAKQDDWNFEEANVSVLSKSIDSFIKPNQGSVVLFYGKNKESEKFMNIFLKVSTSYMEDGNEKIKFGVVNVEKEFNIKSKFEIENTPTVIYYQKGLEVAEFLLGKSRSNFEQFLESPTKFPSQPFRGPASWGEDQSLVAHLSNRNFTSFLKLNPYSLVMFYSPNCGHCVKMKPAYSYASIIVRNENIGAFAAVDCSTSKQICTQYNIEGYPTLHLFLNSKIDMAYPGDRSKEDLITFFKENKFVEPLSGNEGSSKEDTNFILSPNLPPNPKSKKNIKEEL